MNWRKIVIVNNLNMQHKKNFFNKKYKLKNNKMKIK